MTYTLHHGDCLDGLRNMTPRLVGDNSCNNRFDDAVFEGECLLRDSATRVPATNFDDLAFSQFRVVMCASLYAASLALSIFIVVIKCTQKQMFGIYATGIVAVMANAQTFWNSSIMQFVAKTVRLSIFAIYSDFAVSKWISEVCPLPAAIRCRLIDLRPKAGNGIGALVMSSYETLRLAFHPSTFGISLWSNRGKPTTPALAITVWNFVRGIIEGHDDLHSRCVRSRDVDASPAQLVGISIIPQMRGAF